MSIEINVRNICAILGRLLFPVVLLLGPGFYQFFADVPYSLKKSWQKLEPRDMTPSGWLHTLMTYGSCTVSDVIAVALFATVWTHLRVAVSTYLFMPLAKYSKLAPKVAAKLPECLWKFSFSTTAWLYSAYLVLYKYQIFYNLNYTVTVWTLHAPVTIDVYIAYLYQTSFYIQAVVSLIAWDEWRKDSLVLLLHHFVTLGLLTFSYLFRYINLGLLVLFLHDFSDIFLEATKVAVYCKSKGGNWLKYCDFLSTVGFIGFGVSWFVFRLYWFPLKAIYWSSYVATLAYDDVPPFYFFSNGLMLSLLVMHVYWFMFILQSAYNVLTGNARQIDDVREYEGEGSEKSIHRQNGNRVKHD